MRKFFCIVLFFFFLSCNNSDHVPAGIIKPPQMQDIFWDMIRGDILAQEIIKTDSTQTVKSASFAITEKIFKLHHTSRAQFEKSVVFYEKHPTLVRNIFDSLNAVQSRQNAIELEKRSRPVKDIQLPSTKKIL